MSGPCVGHTFDCFVPVQLIRRSDHCPKDLLIDTGVIPGNSQDQCGVMGHLSTPGLGLAGAQELCVDTGQV